jgi:acyl-homoserine-lactone acylase
MVGPKRCAGADRGETMSVRRTGPVVTVLVSCIALLGAACSGGDQESRTADPDATVLGDGDRYEATVRRTEGGVAHITASDLAGLSFGQGWASAEDRACDLADQVLMVNGERSRWFGPGDGDTNIRSDLAWHAIGIRELAAADWETASSEVRELITAYTAGWNGHLDVVGSDGISDWCAGEDWVRPLEPVEVYAYARSIALQASSGAVANFVATAEPPSTENGAGPPGEAGPGPDTTVVEEAVGSNGWAIGRDRSADGGGMLLANPHFPWEGQLRFWEVHLTIPGEIDVYGVQLSGLPGVGIGFTENFGWTHTVSAGKRFTAYRLDLLPGRPTTYRYGAEEREMSRQDITLEVLNEDGEVEEQTHTRWRSHYGPILDFPGVGWTEASTITIRDANIDNDEFVEQYLAMMRSKDLDEFIAAHRDITGVPLFNTVAASADGRAWYADTSATPKLSDEALAAYEESLRTDLLAAGAAQNGAVLLNGSDPLFEWEEVDGARDPGLVPYSEMPVVERSDYVFNANDSFWMPHATEMLEGDYSPLHGPQGTARSPRTRENAVVLDETVDGASGPDGAFTLDELADAALANRGYTSRELKDEVVQRCRDAGTVTVDELGDDDGPTGTRVEVDLTGACDVLESWDGVYDIDRSGPPLWREFVSGFESAELTRAGGLWAQPFDPADPVGTPSGLAAAPEDGGDPVLERLGMAVQVLQKAGVGAEVTLGEVQVAVRGDTVVPIHGGNSADGTTNIVGWGRSWATLDPALAALEREPLAGTQFAEITGDVDTSGYRINSGTSFMLALVFTDQGPRAKAFLTYANTADRDDPAYVEATRRFSAKEWRDVLFDSQEVERAADSTVVVRG